MDLVSVLDLQPNGSGFDSCLVFDKLWVTYRLSDKIEVKTIKPVSRLSVFYAEHVRKHEIILPPLLYEHMGLLIYGNNKNVIWCQHGDLIIFYC